jgi:hypothetical protein
LGRDFTNSPAPWYSMLQTPAPTPPPPPFFQVAPGAYSPTGYWKGYVAQRKELGNQLENLQDQRNSLSERLQDPMVSGADRKGLETRISDLDARIQAVDKQIAAADAQVAQAAAVPGAVVEDPPVYHDDPPPTGAIVGSLFMLLCVFPLTLAYCRRLWRRGGAAIAAVPGELMERMSRLDQAVESIAIEVERIGEGQRFMTRVFTESNARSLGAGAAEPIRQAAKEGAPLHARSSETGR